MRSDWMPPGVTNTIGCAISSADTAAQLRRCTVVLAISIALAFSEAASASQMASNGEAMLQRCGLAEGRIDLRRVQPQRGRERN